MNARTAALALAAIIIVSVSLTERSGADAPAPAYGGGASLQKVPAAFSSQPANLSADVPRVARNLSRNWDALDPEVNAAAALVYSLDDRETLLGVRTYGRWPMASLTKLFTAIVAAETIGYQNLVVLTESAIATEGNGVAFSPGEEFSARDLSRAMVIASSNDAAAAFEEYVGGRAEFLKRARAVAEQAGMSQTVIVDAAGLSSENESSASDILKLLQRIAATHPEIFEWTRRTSFLFQPANDPASRTASNANPFASDARFLGGKTGTLPEARENFAGIFLLDGRRIAVVVLGSYDRVREVNELLDWTARAYQFD
ncbi:MAG: D-alanyl-D-alanine carboxypeptidase [Candidatus Brennerbacteria bacterium]|nr:D-alanyl-D-alanine carboxypeptidase [Candidatus Brennerbacteria bacterium]